jgi:ABC-type amino acid transport substrate-binding protein
MDRQDRARGQINRDRAYGVLGLAITVAALMLAVLFVSLTAAHAEPLQGPARSEQDARFLVQEGQVAPVELQTTSAITLLIATDAAYWPMEYISGTEIVGHDIDLMNAIGAEMSVTIVYTNVGWDDIIDGLVAGEYDALISCMTVTPEREELIDFTLPYVILGDDEEIAIAVQEGDDILRREINEALLKVRADGTLGTIIAAIAADVPQWEPRLPDWPTVYLPLVVAGSGA